MKYIHIPTFIISFAIGIFYVYLHVPKKTTIFIYPHLDNYDNIQYKDKSKTCFNIDIEKSKCDNTFLNYKMQV